MFLLKIKLWWYENFIEYFQNKYPSLNIGKVIVITDNKHLIQSTDVRLLITTLRRHIEDKNDSPKEEHLKENNDNTNSISTILFVAASLVIFILIVSIAIVLLIDYYLRKSALKNKFLPRVHMRKRPGTKSAGKMVNSPVQYIRWNRRFASTLQTKSRKRHVYLRNGDKPRNWRNRLCRICGTERLRRTQHRL